MASIRDIPTLRLLFLAVMIVAVCGAARQPLAEQSQPVGDEAGVEILFAIGEWPPMISEDLPNFGKHAERVQAIFAKMGYRARFVFLPWQRSYELTRRGDYVATFSWLSTAERNKAFHVPRQPIAFARQKGFYKKSRFPAGLDIRSFDDLTRRRLRPVGVASYWYEKEFAERGIEAEIVANIDSAWRFLHAERADILFEEEEVGWMDMANFLGEDVMDDYATTASITTNNMYILFSRLHPQGERLQQAFDAFMRSGEGQEMCKKWSICASDFIAEPAPDSASRADDGDDS